MGLDNSYFNSSEIAIYIHWPFCLKKCPYCDFNSYTLDYFDNNSLITAYFNSIKNQEKFFLGKKITSMFFGGGTPSLMNPDHVYQLIDYFTKINNNNKIAEITLEANPSTFESDVFKDFKVAGVNRISLGIQSFNDDKLKFLGRTHNVKEAIHALEEANNIFSRTNFDLIMGLPNESSEDFLKELAIGLNFFKEHISIYQLTIEPNTPFFKKKIPEAKEEISEEIYLKTVEYLAKKEILMYEISNFSLKDKESLHNLNYWEGGSYLGIGAGAHGRIFNGKNWLTTQEVKNPAKYLKLSQQGLPTLIVQGISNVERIEELIITLLRINRLIPEFIIQYLKPEKLQRVINEGLIQKSIKSGIEVYQTTMKGKLCLNYLLYVLLV